MNTKYRPEGCTDLIGLRFLNPERGEWDYQSTLDVNAQDFPVYAAAPELLEALQRVAVCADTAAHLLRDISPEEAALFTKDAAYAREAIAKATL
jgi:hypothetical protein